MKIKVDKLHLDKSLPVPGDLSKLSDVVKIDVVKKDVYNTTKTAPNVLENNIPSVCNLVKKTD